MQIDTTAPINMPDGTQIVDEMWRRIAGNDVLVRSTPVTLHAVIEGALFTEFEEDKPDGKAHRHKLAVESSTGTIDWSIDDVALVRGRITRRFGASIVGPALALLE